MKLESIQKLLYLLVDIWAGLFTIKTGLFLILHVIYLRRKSEGDYQQDNIYKLMYYLGANYRDLGGLGVVFYATLFYLAVVFVFASRRFIGLFVDLNKHGLVTFITDPVRSKQSVAQALDDKIGLLIFSNYNYQQVISNNIKVNQENQLGKTATNSCVPFCLGRKELRSMAKQQNHLASHNLDHGQHLWPINRRQEWHSSLEKYLLFIYKFLLILFTLMSISIQMLTHWLAHRASVANKIKHADNGKHLLLGWNHLDRLLCLEQATYLILLMDWISYPIAVIILNILDSVTHLRHIKTKLNQLLIKMKQVRTNTRLNDKGDAQDSFECDQDALDLYVQFKMFTNDLSESLKLANLYLSQFNTSLFLSFLTVLTVINNVKKDELKLISIIGLICTVIANGFLLVAAAFNAECARTIRLTWPMMALMRAEEPPETGANSNCRDLVEGYYSGHLVTLHTLILWQRHNQDQTQIMSRYSFKVYGFLRSDYATILRLNFWLVSLIILVLTTNSGRF